MIEFLNLEFLNSESIEIEGIFEYSYTKGMGRWQVLFILHWVRLVLFIYIFINKKNINYKYLIEIYL